MPEFKETYEKSPETMTQAEFKIAMVGLLNSIVERLDIINGKVKVVGKHEVYFRIIGWVAGLIFLPLLIALIIRSFS